MFEQRRHVLSLFLCLVIFTALVVVFRSFIMNSIIQPITLVAWAGWRIISSVPQKIYWGITIAISVFLALRMFYAEWPPESTPKKSYQPVAEEDSSSWSRTFKSALRDANSLNDLRRRLINLYLLVNPQENKTAPKTADEYLRSHPLPVSRDTQLFFSSEKKTLIALISALKLRLLTGLPDLTINRGHKMPSVIFKPVDEILRLMENQMEINHEK